jgi:heme-degrading monooxygenase HmoA
MIVREWRAVASKANAETYIRYFDQKVVPALNTLDGSRGAWLMHRDDDGDVELVALTLWQSRDSIRAFAGPDIGRAHVEPEAQAVLARFDDFVTHYELDLRIDRPA